MALELLSPAGSPEALRAAVQSGCGAVYLGWGSFNARRSAKNFSDEEFADAIRYCHLRSVRVFLTLNTLLTDRELPLALDAARTACRLGVDSVLVQDWGLFALLREALPDLPLHASTQMSVFTAGVPTRSMGTAASEWSLPGSAPGRTPPPSARPVPPRSRSSAMVLSACATPASAK